MRGRRYEDITGKVIKNWTVLRLVNKPLGSKRLWSCRCVCGNTRTLTRIKVSNRKSCGCLTPRGKVHKTYKHGKPPGYSSWLSMKQRVLKPYSNSYKNYGAKGIKIYEPWIDDFTAFITHIGQRPSLLHSIDRIDPSGSYEPGNVKWSTDLEQARNKTNTVCVLFNGVKWKVSDLADHVGMKRDTLAKRIRNGMAVEMAVIFEKNVCRRGHVYADVGFVRQNNARYCKACYHLMVARHKAKKAASIAGAHA